MIDDYDGYDQFDQVSTRKSPILGIIIMAVIGFVVFNILSPPTPGASDTSTVPAGDVPRWQSCVDSVAKTCEFSEDKSHNQCIFDNPFKCTEVFFDAKESKAELFVEVNKSNYSSGGPHYGKRTLAPVSIEHVHESCDLCGGYATGQKNIFVKDKSGVLIAIEHSNVCRDDLIQHEDGDDEDRETPKYVNSDPQTNDGSYQAVRLCERSRSQNREQKGRLPTYIILLIIAIVIAILGAVSIQLLKQK